MPTSFLRAPGVTLFGRIWARNRAGTLAHSLLWDDDRDVLLPLYPLLEVTVKTLEQMKARAGKAGYLLLWLLGVPIPVLLLIFLVRGCN